MRIRLKKFTENKHFDSKTMLVGIDDLHGFFHDVSVVVAKSPLLTKKINVARSPSNASVDMKWLVICNY